MIPSLSVPPLKELELPHLVEEFDWSRTTLGPRKDWPDSVATTVSLILRSNVPMLSLWGPDGVMIYNDAYAVIAGSRHPSLLGTPVRDGWPEAAEFNDDVVRTVLGGRTLSYRGQHLTLQREGRSVGAWFDLDYSPVVCRTGEVLGMLAVVIETTDRVNADQRRGSELDRLEGSDVADHVLPERALVVAEQQSRQIIDGAVDYAILQLDLNGRILRWNEGARRIFGWKREETEGRSWEMLFDAGDAASGEPAAAMDAALERGTAHHNRWHVRKSGDRFWATGSISLLKDEGGRTSGFVKVLRDSTEEYLAAEALAQAEARLKRAQEAGGVGVFSLDLRTNMLSPSAEFCRIFGLEPVDEILVDDVQKHMFADDRSVSSDPDARRAGTAPLDTEYRIRRADDGQIRLIARKGEYERDAEGRPVRLAGVVRDITERRKAEQELRESEARFRALAQAIPNHVWTAQPDGKLDWFNERVFEFSGFSLEELRGDGWAQMVHPDDLERAAALWQSALADGSSYEVEFRLCAADGSYRWHIARAVPLQDDAGRTVRWVGTNTDIQEHREIRAKLEELNLTLEQRVAERTADRDRMWRLSTDIMLVADFKATIVAVNPAWTRVFGWEEQELLGLNFMTLIHPDDIEATLAEVGKLSEGATTFSFENRYQGRDGAYRTISWTAVPDDTFIHAVGRDVTEERAAAETLRKTELALQQAQKMEAIGNLTGGVAHDFNNLLQVVGGNLQLLAKDMFGNDKAQRRIANALTGVERGAKLASQLLAFGRRQALDPRVLNVGRLVRGMDDMLRRTLGEGVEIETVVSGGLWNTLIDPAQLENALLNLAINARDAMEGFGKLTIEVGNAYLDDAYSRQHRDVEPGQYVALSVTDTGSGMSPELMEKVFEPFFTTKPEGKGTGLGLSMVYGFVRQTGGHVKIYSEVGEGTTIRIYLPRSMQQEDVKVSIAEGPVEGGPETILVVEDDEAVRATVVETLQDLGYRVLKAADPTAALNIVESGIPIDLLFTDVVMPGSLTSTELAKKAKERLPRLAVLFTSGYTENSIVHGGRLDRGVQLLSKPYTREVLARKIRQVLDQEAQKRGTKPAISMEAASAPVAEASSVATDVRRVLLVEDNVLIRISTVEMIEELGLEVVEAGSAEEALPLLALGGFDVLIADLGLPGMTGEDFCKEVRRRWPEVAIVFATGASHGPELEDSSRTALLSKPHGLEELKQAMDEASKR
jgi:PAS domain S-box-containing protein